MIEIRDYQKDPWPTKLESFRANQSLYDAVAKAQIDWETSRIENPKTELIEPEILEFEKQFALRRGGLQELILDVDKEEREEEKGEESDIVLLL